VAFTLNLLALGGSDGKLQVAVSLERVSTLVLLEQFKNPTTDRPLKAVTEKLTCPVGDPAAGRLGTTTTVKLTGPPSGTLLGVTIRTLSVTPSATVSTNGVLVSLLALYAGVALPE
jgi:hypothetical protein